MWTSRVNSALPSMRRAILPLMAVLLPAACSDGTRPPEPAHIELSTPRVMLDAVGAFELVTATVRDEGGQALTGAKVTWSGSAGLQVEPTPEVPNRARVTALAGGNHTVSITSGKVTRTLPVDVVQRATTLDRTGDLQVAPVGTTLPVPLQILARDRLGNPVAGAAVTFTPAGGGTVAPASATTDANGVARTVWTLGTRAGTDQTVLALTTGMSATFRATALPGAPVGLEKVAGDAQSGWTGAPLDVSPSVRVVDAHGNGVGDVPVVFTASSGTVDGASKNTNSLGLATVDAWVLGATEGPMTLTATASTLGQSTTFTITAAKGLPMVSLSRAGGNTQFGVEGLRLPVGPAVLVVDSLGVPRAGRTVTFSVLAGGGSVSTASAVTDANGVATVDWTLGALAGPNEIVARITDGAAKNNNLAFTATGCTGGAGAYVINVCVLSEMTAAQRAAFTTAAAKWSAIISADIPDVGIDFPAMACGSGSPAVTGTIDDMIIFARVEAIDGPGKILGSAGPCAVRSDGALMSFPAVGTMRFDAADMETMETNGRLVDVIIHEMGHVLGIGTLWSNSGFLQNPSTPGATPLDTHFSGPQAIVGFDQIGGLSYSLGAKVPVENGAGPGSINSHWRESVLGNELMTPFINTGSNPLTVMTVLSLRDLGYEVNAAAADPLFMADILADRVMGPRLFLGDDIERGPLYTVDRAGRSRRIR